jgi:hypothetical protein
MDLEFSCSNCKQSLVIDESARGMEIQCPNCQQTLTVPNEEPSSAPQPAAPVAAPSLPAEPSSAFQYGYYNHSGTLPIVGAVTMIGLALIGIALLGVVYAYAIFYIPFIYVNVLLAIGYGVAAGFVAWYAAKLGKIRNKTFFVIFGALAGGLFAEYMNWVAWLFAASKQHALLLSPLDIWTAMGKLSERGVWSVKGFMPTGVTLYGFWAIEAAIIVGFAAVFALRTFLSTPFCERCDKWVEETLRIKGLQPITNPEDLKVRVEGGDFSPLLSMRRARVESSTSTRVDLLHCPQCLNLFLLTVTSVETETNSKGEDEEKESMVVQNLLIDVPTYESLKQCGKTQPQTARL